LFFVETWLNGDIDCSVSKFDYYKLNRPKKVKARRDSGGLIVYFRNELLITLQIIIGYYTVDCTIPKYIWTSAYRR